MKKLSIKNRQQNGASLLEVLIAILILSFGMLALGSMLSFAVQLPKLSNYRAIATNMAASHIDRIRANPTGFYSGNYDYLSGSYDGTFTAIPLATCKYPNDNSLPSSPNCTVSALATMDIAATNHALRIELPAGGMVMSCDTTPCSQSTFGNLWIVWQEPTTFAALAASSVSDNCPTNITGTVPKPRCLYVRFKL